MSILVLGSVMVVVSPNFVGEPEVFVLLGAFY